MINLRHKILSLAIAFSTLFASAAVSDLPVKTVNGKQYFYYEVQPKETLYSLQQKLGVGRETIIKYNPSVEDGLRAYETLYFPVGDEFGKPKPHNPSSPHASHVTVSDVATHEVKKGETIYGISKKYNLTPEELIALNPSLRDGIKAGQVLRLSESKANNTTHSPAQSTAGQYTIQKGESLYSIAQAHGITVEDILAANPGLDPTYYQGGQIITIPQKGSEKNNATAVATPIKVETPTESPEVAEGEQQTTVTVPAEIAIEEGETTIEDNATRIAVMLPFMLKEEKVSKNAARNTEFYQGFLMAVNKLKSSERPIHVYTYDTSSSIDEVNAILRRPEMKQMQAIIAPPEDAQFFAVARFGRDNDIMVVNPFIVKDGSQRTNKAVIQINIPGDEMQDKAVRGAVDLFGDRRPVILTTETGGDHEEFVDAFKTAFYANEGPSPVTITYNGKLTAENLSRLAQYNDDFLFIPTSGKQTELNNILPAIVALRSELENPSRVKVFGYPEWIMYRGETLENMRKADTVFYSRFVDPDNSVETPRFNETFKFWYGNLPVSNALPRQAYLGYDLGTYLIKALRENKGDFNKPTPSYHGLQNGLHVVKHDGQQGWSNDIMYFIQYRPSGLVDSIEL